MEELIKIIDKNLFLLNTDLLGVDEAQLWIGAAAEGPEDNEDKRVLREREEAEKDKNSPDWMISGIEAVNLTPSEKYPGWFEVNTASWKSGIYRFMIHGRAGVKTPKGTKLQPYRDGQYSWPSIPDEEIMNLSDEQKSFLYLEKNKEGFCFRIEIDEERTIKPAGDGLEWASQWKEIKKEVNEHLDERKKAVYDK